MAASEAAVTAVTKALDKHVVDWNVNTTWHCSCGARFGYRGEAMTHRAMAAADAAVDADRASIQAETRRETFAEASRAMNRVADIWERDRSDPCRVRVNRENANAYRLYAEGLGEPTGSRKETKPWLKST